MAREIYWHGLMETALACAAILTETSPGFSTSERREQLWRQVSIQARCALHLDSGMGLLARWRTVRFRRSKGRGAGLDVMGPDGDGFFPLSTLLGHGKTGVFKTGGSAVDLQDFEASVAALRAGETALSAKSAPPAWAATIGQTLLCRILERQADALRASGIEPIYFIGPGTTREQSFLDLAARGVVPRLLAFNDPAAYPELYRPEMRADRYHLNPIGAHRLTELLVQRLTGSAAFKRQE